MAIGVDSSGWKPRKVVGTPAGKVRDYIAVGILSFGLICGAIFHFSNFPVPLKKLVETLYEDPISEVERKIMIASGLPYRTGDTIRKQTEEESRPDLPHK